MAISTAWGRAEEGRLPLERVVQQLDLLTRTSGDLGALSHIVAFICCLICGWNVLCEFRQKIVSFWRGIVSPEELLTKMYIIQHFGRRTEADAMIFSQFQSINLLNSKSKCTFSPSGKVPTHWDRLSQTWGFALRRQQENWCRRYFLVTATPPHNSPDSLLNVILLPPKRAFIAILQHYWSVAATFF